jgi:hypothetical protein
MTAVWPVDRRGAAALRSRARRLPQPTHIYASTQHRRGRRWNRRRPVWPAAVTAIGALGAIAVLANELLRNLG